LSSSQVANDATTTSFNFASSPPPHLNPPFQEYDEAYVIQAVSGVCRSVITKQKAEECVQEATQHGTSEICVVPEEEAEHIVEQLKRCDPIVFATIEPGWIILHKFQEPLAFETGTQSFLRKLFEE